MSNGTLNSWQSVQDEIRRRISLREWEQGEFIPHEADLASEFGCARATVNRALRGLADAGILERKRKAGTKVALNPVRLARFEIPVIRDEIEGKGLRFSHNVLKRETRTPPADIRARMQTIEDQTLLHLETLYTANGAPYVFEDRWISLEAVPAALDAAFDKLSPNEWLVREVPFDGGDFTFSAISATAREAEILSCASGSGLFVLDRSTRNAGTVITSVRLIFHAGYQMHTEI